MMQLKSGDAAYYHSAEYCRNYTSPPTVTYGHCSHYLPRLPGESSLDLYHEAASVFTLSSVKLRASGQNR
ncbi:unnamed protein product [Pleuronectes platessa]|uniref:Uncharacterized protein n=1 Tax=Pleuronectes platessa TaxID=8262 RepID=A0A9N7UVE1_PLEPL|nr:unnamed protein product [Pleuronectes platessa]